MKSIVKKITLEVPVKVIWDKWTTEGGIKSFFAKKCKVQLEIGGAFEMYFLLGNQQGLQGSEGCKILSYLPEKMLSFSWNAPPEYPTVRGIHTWVVLLFKESGAHTELTLTHLGWGTGEEWDKVYAYFENAWDFVFNKLKESI
ncbi:SRPBCC family protein [Fulvivirga lutea]|uniref:SRPBCC domain-containing protein n=1 Tax=Fulvivirga lutea TaxID=2810512 RepID=A0A974WH46_9BACT|nr:SRPBCC domain-containing protein [Fulvivirga lutea]QSE98251.1 SRPBCC domain-containing protein [Fulvivirga lutea]